MDLDKVNFDNEVLAYLSVRKDELIESHDEYIISHPEIREVLNDFLSSVLLKKPVSFSITVLSHIFPPYRMMFTFMPRSTSIHSIQLQWEESHSSLLVHLVSVKTLFCFKCSRSTKVSSRKKSVLLLDQLKSTRKRAIIITW